MNLLFQRGLFDVLFGIYALHCAISGIKMNGFQNGKSRTHDKPSPGCLGRIVNLFDLNSGVAGNRMLTDKPHRDGPLSRSQSDLVRLSPSSEDQVEEKLVVSNLKRTCSNRKSNGTPMKMLIAQEMSKEDSSHNPPSVVAKLMGLDALPQKSVPAIKSHFVGHSRCHTDSSFSYCQHKNESLTEEMQQEFHQYPKLNEYKDGYEVWKHPPKMNCVRSKSPQKARHGKTSYDKKSAFVRQKFIEAKCLSIDEQLSQSKEFQDALDVLSSNTDLFLKFLQEPNPMFSQHLYNLPSIPPPPETKRITVLRPSKMVDDCKFGGSVKKNEKELNRTTHVGLGNRTKNHMAFSPPTASWNIDENHAQPTRIVVLKPSLGKTHNFRVASSSPSASSRVSQTETSFVNMEANEAQESREVAKAITQHMRVNIGGYQRDETLLSSVFADGYIGDEISLNKSEKEYAAGSLGDSEVMSPASRHSWEYINRFGSPYSCSSLSRASYSPESSVSREAKKRLSERWAMVASNGSCQEQRQMRRSPSSTLGEMLALSDIKTEGRIEQESIKEDLQISNSNSVSNSKDDEAANKSPNNLLRSKSVPVFSTAFSSQLNVGAPDLVTGENDLPKTTKLRSTKSSLKGKVSNLFFSRNKKPNNDGAKCLQSNDELQSGAKPLHSLSKVDKYSEFLDDPWVECSATYLREPSCALTCEDLVGKQGATSPEVVLSEARSLHTGGHPCENQDQPSPISVLETPFEEGEHQARISSGGIKPDRHGAELSLHPIRSNLIDKSPPIGSIARTLSWDDSCADTAISVCMRPSSSTQRIEEVECEWFSLVQTLLTMAGLDEVQSNAFSTMWHSPESPLDPSLREQYIDLNEKETLHKAKRRQRRSTQKLVFDCVNAALLEIAGYGPDNCQRAIPYMVVHNNPPQGTRLVLLDQVWDRMKEWLSSEVKYPSTDGGDLNSPVVEGMVRKEVMGKWWLENLSLELDNVGIEIEEKLLEELVHESVVELAGRM